MGGGGGGGFGQNGLYSGEAEASVTLDPMMIKAKGKLKRFVLSGLKYWTYVDQEIEIDPFSTGFNRLVMDELRFGARIGRTMEFFSPFQED